MRRLVQKKGFSLVELMIVLVVVGILAAVAVPIYTSQVKKARMSEADAALGTIRTQLRIYYGENGVYPTAVAAENVVGADWNDIVATELDGKYFTNTAYTYISAAGITYTLTCAGGTVLDSDRTMDQAGTLAGGID